VPARSCPTGGKGGGEAAFSCAGCFSVHHKCFTLALRFRDNLYRQGGYLLCPAGWAIQAMRFGLLRVWKPALLEKMKTKSL
jgi:hypothetical protein